MARHDGVDVIHGAGRLVYGRGEGAEAEGAAEVGEEEVSDGEQLWRGVVVCLFVYDVRELAAASEVGRAE